MTTQEKAAGEVSEIGGPASLTQMCTDRKHPSPHPCFIQNKFRWRGKDELLRDIWKFSTTKKLGCEQDEHPSRGVIAFMGRVNV